MTMHKTFKTGSNPRTLPEYIDLRNELGKLTHPARPDVDWHYVEKRCLSLFKQNGVELQTAAWYTLARAQLAGAGGLCEGLAILEELITRRWEAFWPQAVHVRMDILNSLSLRLQQLVRALPFAHSDLSQLYIAEQQIANIDAALQRLEIKNCSQFKLLQTMMLNSAAMLKNSDIGFILDKRVQSDTQPAEASVNNREIPGDIPATPVGMEKNDAIHVATWKHAAQPHAEVVSARVSPLQKMRSFIAGMCTMLALTGIGLWCWQKIYTLHTPIPIIANEASLETLAQLSPLWRQQYGFTLAASAKAEEAEKLSAQWRQHIASNALPSEKLAGWHKGMEGLQEMTRQLNALDVRKGKYLTGSELKTMVFAITQDFARAPPLEEQLYQLSQYESGKPPPERLLSETDMHMNQLLNRYMLIRMVSPAGIEPATSP